MTRFEASLGKRSNYFTICRCIVLVRRLCKPRHIHAPCAEKHEIANFAWPRCNNFIALRQRIVIQLTKFLGQWNGVVVCDQTPRRLIALRPLRIRFCFVWKQISVKLSVRFLILILFCTNRLCTTRFYHCLIVILGQIWSVNFVDNILINTRKCISIDLVKKMIRATASSNSNFL